MQHSSPESKVRQTAFLDGIRGIAALLVYLHHFAPPFFFYEHHKGFGQLDPSTGERTYHFTGLPIIRLLYTGGDAAVATFFVLSGFVLAWGPLRKINANLERRHSRLAIHKSIVSAILRRPIRLYLPALAVVTTFAVLRHTPIVPRSDYPTFQPSVFQEVRVCWKEFIRFFNPFQEHGINMNWFLYSIVVWTLPIELKGSVLIFTLMMLFETVSHSRFQRRAFVCILSWTVLLLLFINQWTISLFMAGMLLAFDELDEINSLSIPLFYSTSKSTCQPVYHLILLTGLYLLTEPSHRMSIGYSLYTPGWYILTKLIPSSYLTENEVVGWHQPEYYRFWTSIGAVLMVHAIANIKWLQRILSTRIPQYLGKVSFMLYLTHPIVGEVANVFFMRLNGQWADPKEAMGLRWYDNMLYLPDWGFMGLTVRYVGNVLIQLPVALAIAHIFTILYDQPALRLAHRIVNVIGPNRGAKGIASCNS